MEIKKHIFPFFLILLVVISSGCTGLGEGIKILVEDLVEGILHLLLQYALYILIGLIILVAIIVIIVKKIREK